MEETKVLNAGELLNEMIIEDINTLGDIDFDMRKQAIDEIERLYKLRIEENKALDNYYNEEQRRKLETETQAKRLEAELEMHRDKMKLEFERLESERLMQEKDIEIKAKQAKIEKQKMWADIASKGVIVGAYMLISYGVMNLEKTGSIRSKAFSNTIPKLKFW